MISEFGDWLRSRTNKQKRPYQEETITAYSTGGAGSVVLDDVGWHRGGINSPKE